MKEVIGIILLTVLFQHSKAQIPYDYCGFPDTLKSLKLGLYVPGKSSYSDRFTYYQENECMYELKDYEGDSIATEIKSIGFSVYVAKLDGEIEELILLMREGDQCYTWSVNTTNSVSGSVSIFRPDSVNHPHIIQIRYPHNFGSGMGSYHAVTHEFWDVKRKVRLAEVYSNYGEFYRSSSVNDLRYEAGSYSLTRDVVFQNGELVIQSYPYVKSKTVGIKNDKGEFDRTETKTRISCKRIVYQLTDDMFVKKGN